MTIFAPNSIKVKNLSLILNGILIVAVGFLYFKVYSNQEAPIKISGQAAASKIVFLNSDSLMDNYTLFNNIQKQLEKKKDSLDQVFTVRGKALEAEIQNYQETGASLSDQQRQAKEESLTRKQQAYISERDAVLETLKNEETLMTDSLHNDLMRFLKDFNKKNNYDFILGYSRGGAIFLASDSLDITKVVLSGLNKK
jgi:outer membrane protein